MLVLQGSNPGSTVEIPESQPIHGIGHIFGWEFMDEKNKRRTFSEVCEVLEVLWPFFFFSPAMCFFVFERSVWRENCWVFPQVGSPQLFGGFI